MKELKNTCYKGTRIQLGNEKRVLINNIVNYLIFKGFEEIQIPIIQFSEIYQGKIGENSNLMFTFEDKVERKLCLPPEYTAVCQRLANTYFMGEKDVKIFYVQQCFRGEKPQAGRWREFTQVGVEILNPTKDYREELLNMVKSFISNFITPCSSDWYKEVIKHIKINREVTRGLDYYKDGQGFEVSCDLLGTSNQVCGGGAYTGGVGFAVGVDRLMLLTKFINNFQIFNENEELSRESKLPQNNSL